MQGIASIARNTARSPRRAAVLSLCVAALALTGCSIGSGDSGDTTIPADQASELESQLNSIRSAIVRDDCAEAKAEAQQFAAMAANTSTDSAVKNALSEGADQMTALVERDVCTETGATSTETTPDTATAAPELSTSSTTPETSTEDTQQSDESGNGGETTSPPAEAPGSSGSAPPSSSGNPGHPVTGGIGSGGTSKGSGD